MTSLASMLTIACAVALSAAAWAASEEDAVKRALWKDKDAWAENVKRYALLPEGTPVRADGTVVVPADARWVSDSAKVAQLAGLLAASTAQHGSLSLDGQRALLVESASGVYQLGVGPLRRSKGAALLLVGHYVRADSSFTELLARDYALPE